MPEPIAFFGQRIEGGGEIIPIDALRDFVITNIAFADDVKGNARAVIKVHHTILPGMDSLGGEDDEEEEEEEEEDEEEEIEEQSFVVAHLHPGKIDQVSVNLHFSSEELIGFSVSGDNAIELIGNYVASPLGYDQDPDSDEDGYSGFGESDSDEEIDSDAVGSLPELKRRIGSRADAELEEDDDDEDDDDFSDDGEIDLEMIGGEDSEDEDDEDRFEEIDDSKISASAKANGAGKAKAAAAAVLGDAPKPSKKRSAAALEDAEGDVSMASTAGGDATDAELAAIAAAEGLDITNLSKNQRKRLNKKLRASSGEAVAPPKADKAEKKAATTASPAAKEAPAKKEKEVPAKKEKEAPKKVASKKQKLPSGVEIEDIKVGSGPAAKPGNKLGMRYIGRLTNGKQFDSNTSGKPFGFKLGRGEVIKGWDEGLRGMQVGGERRLTIPPASAYGSSGAPPTIPRNATLVFDVKLVEIK